MDKLAYHFNKKKIPAETEGKYLYYYPCDDLENATVRMGKDGYLVIEVTEKEWEALFELDRIDYNNEHKYVRHTSPILSAGLPCRLKKAILTPDGRVSTGSLACSPLISTINSSITYLDCLFRKIFRQ